MVSRLLTVFLISPFIVTGQTVYKGIVTNGRTKEKIPFVTVGLTRENTGCNADEQGHFELSSFNTKKADTLIFSCIGYEILKVPVDINIVEYNAALIEKPVNLQPVTVYRRQKYSVGPLLTLNKKASERAVLVNPFSISQYAKHCMAPVENSLLKSVRLLTDGKKSKFRIRVYDIDSVTAMPSGDLCEEVIDVTSGKGEEVEIDLEKYNIILPHKDYFVSVEWIKIPFNRFEQKHERPPKYYYRPVIQFLDHRPEQKNWILDYRNNWQLIMALDIAISSTVMY